MHESDIYERLLLPKRRRWEGEKGSLGALLGMRYRCTSTTAQEKAVGRREGLSWGSLEAVLGLFWRVLGPLWGSLVGSGRPLGAVLEAIEPKSCDRQRGRTHACASISHLMKESARSESEKAPESWEALRVSL